SDSYWDKYESEANNFAAQLLMPKSLVISEGSKIITRYKEVNNVGGMPVEDFIEKISRSLQVSTKAMEYRLKNLNVI
ncbi:MAG: ImmA/IrrE family metallo-endopeptidase, partial [Pseudomonadales bacterium]|nr:ImmA/IrrE family metallo-endopeptidase [Pseudomonadales bacterium]